MKEADRQIIARLGEIYDAQSAGGAAPKWGDIVGTLLNQTDLQAALDAKQASLGFTPVPNTRTVNGHALSADVTVSKSDVGLGNADNTSDVGKPVSTAQATAIAANVSDTAYDATSWDAVTTIAPSKNAVRDKIESMATPYLVYTALLTQTGTDAPVAVVLQNTLGGTVVWTRDVSGIYIATSTGVFTVNKTIGFVSNVKDTGSPAIPTQAKLEYFSADVVMLTTFKNDNTSEEDGHLNASSIEIRVYP